jgi:hypothetical protein
MSLGNDNEENDSDGRNQTASHESETSSSTPFSGHTTDRNRCMILLGSPILLFVGQDSVAPKGSRLHLESLN